MQNNYDTTYSLFSLPEKPYSYSPLFGGSTVIANQPQEDTISFPEEGNYTINFKFFNNKNEIQYNNTIQKKVSSLETNIILYSSTSSLIFSGVNIIFTIAIILLSSFSFIQIFKLMYDNIFKKIEEGYYDDALKNILKPLFYLYSLYLFTSFLLNLLLSPAMLLRWVSNNIEWFIILFAFYSLLFTRKLRNHNIISLLFALYILGIFINDIKTHLSNLYSLFSGGFLEIIITYSSLLIYIILGVVYIISFSSIMVKLFSIVLKALNPENVSLIKINFRNKIKEYNYLISLLPDFISFYLVYVILKNLYMLQEIIHVNLNPYSYYSYSILWIIFAFFLLIVNILIKRIMEIEKLSIKSLLYYIISFLLIFLSLVAIDGIMFIEGIMMSYYGLYNIEMMPYYGLLYNMDTMMSYNYWLYDAIILITVVWYCYIFIIYSKNISYFIHKHFSRFRISK